MTIKTQTCIKHFGKLLISLLLCHSGSLLAADDDLFFDMPVVLSVNRLEQPASDAAASISIIDRQMIEASGARAIPDILRLVPGMQVGYSGNEFGTEPVYAVTYHGQSGQYSKQIQILIDGRSIYNPFFGGILWKAIPVNIDDIERIEVSRGPNPATYGSNSFQAAINIITRTAAEDQGSYVRTNIGNHDIADMTYRYGDNNGKLDYRITASTLNDNGLDSANQYDNPDDTHSNNIDYRLDYQLDNKNTLSYQGGYGNNSQQADKNHDQDGGGLPTTRTVDNMQFFQFIKWENVVNKENTFLLQYYYNLTDKQDIYDPVPITYPPADPFLLEVDASRKSERHNLEFTHFIYPDENLKLIWGISAQTDFVKSPLYLGTDKKISHKQYRSFANIEWHLNQSNIVNIGGLLETNTYSDTEFSPRISIIHAFNERHKVRLGVSQAIRSPFIFDSVGNMSYSQELTSGGVPAGVTLVKNIVRGNTNLQNEKITSQEIVYMGEFINASLLFNARLFHDTVTDFIDTVKLTDTNSDSSIILFDTTVYEFRNSFTNSTAGLELEIDYRINPMTRVIASGAIINISSDFKAMTLSAPQHSFSTMLTRQFNKKYNGSLAYYYVQDFNWTDARDSTGGYQILDMRLSRNFKFSQTKGSLSIVLKNLLDDYSDYQQTPDNTTAPQLINNTLAYIDFRLNF